MYRAALGLLGAVVALGLALPGPTLGVVRVLEGHAEPENLDARKGIVEPSAAQRALVTRLGARATWNRFGTPQSLIRDGGYLATGLSGAPVEVAREFVRRNRALFRLSAPAVDRLELVNDGQLPRSDAHAVLFRQSFGGLRAGQDGMIAVGVVSGRVAYASSSAATSDARLTGNQRLTAQDAFVAAARDLGRRVTGSAFGELQREGDWNLMHVRGFEQPGRARLVAVPLPGSDARRAYEVNVSDVDGEDVLAYTVFVDAESGRVLLRHSRLNHLADAPRWRYFTANPLLTLASDDIRIVGCFPNPAGALPPECEFDFRTTPAAAPAHYDRPGSTNTTHGNNATTALSSTSPFTPGPDAFVRPTSPTRDYLAPFRNVWQQEKCNPAVFATGLVPATGPHVFGGTDANDVNAAIVSLFVNHNRMHDWSYNLGFTEPAYNLQMANFGRGGRDSDPEIGDAQGGSLAGGNPTFTGRDNANQITFQDGVAPITNMYLWQPVAGAFYPPCVDGDFDMAVIGHEYTHAISNRMVGGPDAGLQSGGDGQATSMGESYSDLTAVEYLFEHGYVPTADENPFSVGAYVTGSKEKGVRNYGMNDSPLNYSDVQGYDGMGSGSPHDDGEIWSAANYDMRQSMIRKYDDRFPASDMGLQRACASGAVAPDACPGNRRWMQIVFDAYLLMQPAVSMLDARDAYLAADMMRFGGANQAELWRAFAGRGFGANASTAGTNDANPMAGFESPVHGDEATIRFLPVDPEQAGSPRVDAQIYVGDYESSVTPIADTDPLTPLPASASFVPGTYSFIARARGYGAFKFTRDLRPEERLDLQIEMAPNHAASARGAAVTGEGVNLDKLIDETEATNWAVLARTPSVTGAQATVKLARGAQLVDRVNVSGALRPAGSPVPEDPRDPRGQNRFTALRQFELHACNEAEGQRCEGSGATYTKVFTSAPDAFPGAFPRPLAPDVNLRSFDVPDTRATHLRLVVLHNQCTGYAPFQDEEQERDPSNSADCRKGSALVPRQDLDVRAAELQAFSREPRVVVLSPGGAGRGVAPARPSRRFLISRRAIRLTAHGVARVRMSCRATSPCRGTLRLMTAKRFRRGAHVRRIRLGTARFSIQSKRRRTLGVRLSRASRRLVERERRVRVLAIANLLPAPGDAGGRRATANASFRLVRAPRAPRRR